MTSNKQKKKGKTVSLAEFLDPDSKIVSVRSNWSEIVDREEETTTSKSTLVDLGALPTAPRAALEANFSHVSEEPPFVACATNLSFQIDDEGLRRIFADLNPKSARILTDNGRSRGIGLVEFEKRDHLIEALKRTGKELYGRTINVYVSDKTDSHHSGGRSGFRNRNEGEERPEMDRTWERGVRSDNNFDGRKRGFNRDGPNRNEFSRQNQRGPRDHQESNSFGYGYPRSRDDRGGHGGNRDHNNRPSQRFRQHEDESRPNSGIDRPRYSGRYSDNRDVRDRPTTSEETSEEQREAPRERPRLHLQPRTKPLDPEQTVTKASSSTDNTAEPSIHIDKNSETSHRDEDSLSNNDHQEQSNEHGSSESSVTQKAARGAGSEIFGGAKPVDTLSKELEIEKKIKDMELNVPDSPGDEHHEKQTSRSSYNRPNDRDHPRGKRSSHNEDHHPRDRHQYRRDDGRSDHGTDYHHKREHSGGKQYEDDSRRRNDDDQYRRGGSERFGGGSRRDHDTARSNKYQHHNQGDRDHDRGNFRQRDRDSRHSDSSEANNQGRTSNNFNTESQARNGRGNQSNSGMNRRVAPAQENSHRLELSNKFGMLDDDDLDDGDDIEEPQSPTNDS